MSAQTNIDRTRDPFEGDVNPGDTNIGAKPDITLDDADTQEFFVEGDKISRENKKTTIEDEPDKEIGWLKRKMNGWFSKERDEAKKTMAEVAAIAAGSPVGSEGQTANEAERAKAASDAQEIKKIENKTNVLNLKGNADFQLAQLECLRKKLLPDVDPYDKDAIADAKYGPSTDLYRKLVKRGSTQNSKTGKYSKVSDAEQAQLSEYEGPVITQKILTMMSNGEIPWTVNGIFKASGMLQNGLSPRTGERLSSESNRENKDADVIDIKTGLKRVAQVAGAAAGAIAGAAILGSSGEKGEPLHGSDPATQEAEKILSQAIATEREQKDLLDEIAQDTEILKTAIDANQDPEKRLQEIEKLLPMLAEYKQRVGTAEEQAMDGNEFLEKTILEVLKPLENDSNAKKLFLESQLRDGMRAMADVKQATETKLDEAKKLVLSTTEEYERLKKADVIKKATPAERKALQTATREQIEERSSELYEKDIDELEATSLKLQSANKDETFDLLVKDGYLTALQAEILKNDKKDSNFHSLRQALAEAYEKAADEKMEIFVKLTGKTKPQATGELSDPKNIESTPGVERATILKSAQRMAENLSSELCKKDIDELEAMPLKIKSASRDETLGLLVKDGILTAQQAERLKKGTNIHSIRLLGNKLAEAYEKAADEKMEIFVKLTPKNKPDKVPATAPTLDTGKDIRGVEKAKRAAIRQSVQKKSETGCLNSTT